MDRASGLIELPAEFVFLGCFICSLVLLLRELVSRPGPWRAAGIVATLIASCGAALQFGTGFYLAMRFAEVLNCLVAVEAYLAALFLVATGKWIVLRLRFVIATVGLAVPMLWCLLNIPGLLVVGLMIMGNETNSRVFTCRLSPTMSYHIDRRYPLIGSYTPFYSYTIYRNPLWLPLVEEAGENENTPCDAKTPITIQ